MMFREISHSEVSTALDCFAKHAFAYTGALTGGDALKAKTVPPMLRDGRAWGAAVAGFHQFSNGYPALVKSLREDASELQEAGLYDEQDFAATLQRLTRMLDHYVSTTERLPLVATERELITALPSRGGHRHSTRYRLRCYLDGIHHDAQDRTWIVEFKLRKQLQSLEQISLSRQIRWYAWAWRERTGVEPAGVIVDERLNALPEPVRLNQNGTPSKVQSCSATEYEQACRLAGSTADLEVMAKLNQKVWQQRHPILFRPAELEEAGWQLVSAANLIRQLDAGSLYPIRNPHPANCNGCQFRAICPTPEDGPLLDSLYNRTVPKRDRDYQEAA